MKRNILIVSTIVLLSTLANGIQKNVEENNVGFSETTLFENANNSAIKLIKRSKLDRGETVNLEGAESNSDIVSKVLVQTKDNGNNSRDIRYVAAFKVKEYDPNAVSINVKEIGFNVQYTLNDTEYNYSYPVTTVYSSINANGKTYDHANQDVFVTNEKSYDYFMTYAINNIPLESYGNQITVRPYVKFADDEQYHTSNTSKVASVYGDMLSQADWVYTEHVKNGDFEQGLSSWTLSDPENPILRESPADSTYWDGRQKHYGNGEKFARGDEVEGNTGTMTSEPFMLAGDGYVTARIGGCGDQSKCYITVNDAITGEEVGRMSNTHFEDPARAENLNFYYINLSEYKGKLLKVVIHDDSTGGFGFVEVDDIKTSLTEAEMHAAFKEAMSIYGSDDNSITATSVRNLYYSHLIESNYSANTANNIASEETYTVDGIEIKAELSISKDGVSLTAVDGKYNLNENGIYTAVTTYTLAGDTLYTIEETVGVGVYILNGGFETGNLSGWTVSSGNVKTEAAVISDKTFWVENISYNQGGNYHFDGWKANTQEAEGYSLKSSNFTLSGTGMISFKMGGNAARLSVYKADGTLLKTYKNAQFADVNFPYVSGGSRLATMVTNYADLSAYLGQELYIVIEDKVIEGGWAVAFFDDIVTYYATETAATLSSRYDTVKDSKDKASDDVKINWVAATEE